ncbi:hypothetical protein ABK040_014747 [Willaertia magna]
MARTKQSARKSVGGKKQKPEKQQGVKRNQQQTKIEENETKKVKSDKACKNCGKEEFLFLQSRSCGNSYYTLPGGKEKDGYLPNFAGLCDSDGITIQVCVECGTIFGFDKEQVQEQIRLEKEQDKEREEEKEENDEEEE